jgi:hypothetical protein
MSKRPNFVCVAGSMKKDPEAFALIYSKETFAGNIVMMPPGYGTPVTDGFAENVQADLLKLGFWKVDAADYLYVVNTEGYVGEGTAALIAYAIYTKTPIRFTDERAGTAFLEGERHRIGALLGSFMLDGPPHRLKKEEEAANKARTDSVRDLVAVLLGPPVDRDKCDDEDCETHGERVKAERAAKRPQ